MATTNQGWALPTVGGSQDTWGTTLNTTIEAIDTLVGGVSAAEIAKLDGLTATTAELNILDGVTATAAELNILDGVSATAAELNILDGVTATTTELNYVDGVTSNIQTQLNTKISGNQTITLSGDVSGSGTTSIVVTVADDSHNHVISNVDGLQTSLDEKLKLPNTSWTTIGTVNSTTRQPVTRGEHYALTRSGGSGDFTFSIKNASSGGSDITKAIFLMPTIVTSIEGTSGGWTGGFYALASGYFACTTGTFVLYRTT